MIVNGQGLALARLSDKTIRTIHRIAKAKNKGLRPFFADPHAMIELRNEKERRTCQAKSRPAAR